MSRPASAPLEGKTGDKLTPDKGQELQNRAHQRHYTTLRVAKIATEAIEGLGLVRNVSSGGMMVDAKAPLEIGQTVTISLFDGQKLEARVVWEKGGQIGLAFDVPVDVKDLLTIPDRLDHGKTPRPPRLRVDRSAIIDAGRNTISAVTICDLSQRGAKILFDKPLTRNQDVWLWLTGMHPLSGTVRWVHGKHAGIAFHDRLGVNELMTWLAGNEAQN